MGYIHSNLSEILGRHRLKQSELAQATGIRPTTINHIFHDKYAAVSRETLLGLVEGLRKLTGHPYTLGDIFEYREE